MGIFARLFGSAKAPTVEYCLKLNDRDRRDQQKERSYVENRVHYLQERLLVLLCTRAEAIAGEWPGSESQIGQIDERILEKQDELEQLEDRLYNLEQKLCDLRAERQALIERMYAPLLPA